MSIISGLQTQEEERLLRRGSSLSGSKLPESEGRLHGPGKGQRQSAALLAMSRQRVIDTLGN